MIASLLNSLLKEAGARRAITLFHRSPAHVSQDIRTSLNAVNSKLPKTQNSSLSSNEIEGSPCQFDLEFVENYPTVGQVQSILEYAGDSQVGKVIRDAKAPHDALKIFKENPSSFIRPILVDWNGGKLLFSDNPEEISNFLKSLPKD